MQETSRLDGSASFSPTMRIVTGAGIPWTRTVTLDSIRTLSHARSSGLNAAFRNVVFSQVRRSQVSQVVPGQTPASVGAVHGGMHPGIFRLEGFQLTPFLLHHLRGGIVRLVIRRTADGIGVPAGLHPVVDVVSSVVLEAVGTRVFRVVFVEHNQGVIWFSDAKLVSERAVFRSSRNESKSTENHPFITCSRVNPPATASGPEGVRDAASSV